MDEHVTGGTEVHIRDQIVAGQLLSQNSEGLSSRRQLQQLDAGPVPQSRVRLRFVPECTLQPFRIESQSKFTSVETLSVRIPNVDRRHEKHPHFVHESLWSHSP